MRQRAWVRMGAVSGLVYVILLIAGFVIGVASAPTPPSVFGTPEQVGAQIAQAATIGVWVGLYMEVVALLCFVVFAAFLRTMAQPAGRDAPWPVAAAYGAALIFVCLQLLSMAILGIVTYRAGTGADVSSATALLDLRLGSYILSWAVGALWLGLTCINTLRDRMLSRGFSVVGLVIAVLWLASCLIPTSGIAQLGGFVPLVWTAVASIMLVRRTDQRRDATSSGVLSSVTPS